MIKLASGYSRVEVGAFEAKSTLGALLDRVEAGEEIVITRRGRPEAKLVPSVGGADREEVRAAVGRIRQRAKQLGTFDWQVLNQDRDNSRP